MALASVFSRLDQLESKINSFNGISLSSGSSVDMSKYDDKCVLIDSIASKVSDLESKQLPMNLVDRVTELEAQVSKLPEFHQKLQTIESNVIMLLEHVKAIDLTQLKGRVAALESKEN